MVIINYKDPRPIYEQVKDGLSRQIISGVLESGEKLPSVRDLAAALAINPNTIQRAYRELETEGYIYSVAGKGSFAGECGEIRESRKSTVLARLDELVTELCYLGMSRELVAQHVTSGGARI